MAKKPDKKVLALAKRRTRIRDNDFGYLKIVKEVKRLSKRSTFSVGVFDDNPRAVIKAAVHEFGERKSGIPGRRPTPRRKWLSKFFDENKDQIASMFKEMYLKIAVGGGTDKDLLYKEYSNYLLAGLRDWMQNTEFPPALSAVTIAEKTTPYPLIETYEMMYATAIKVSRSSKGGSGGKQIAPSDAQGAMPALPTTPAPPKTPVPAQPGGKKPGGKKPGAQQPGAPQPSAPQLPKPSPPPRPPKPPQAPKPPARPKKPRRPGSSGRKPRPPRPPRPRRVRQQKHRNTGRRPGRARSSGVLKKLRTLARVLIGPALYEGYGQRRRPDKKPGTSTTVRWGSGYKRMPVRSKGGRYPSDSRPKK